jgi:serine/threonine protein kinase
MYTELLLDSNGDVKISDFGLSSLYVRNLYILTYTYICINVYVYILQSIY